MISWAWVFMLLEFGDRGSWQIPLFRVVDGASKHIGSHKVSHAPA